MVLAGYGGASLLFFGVSPSRYQASFGSQSRSSSSASEMASEERQLAHAIDASEAEAVGNFLGAGGAAGVDTEHQQYSWWDVLLGKHDQEIFERAAGLGVSSKKAKEEIKAKMTATAVCTFS